VSTPFEGAEGLGAGTQHHPTQTRGRARLPTFRQPSIAAEQIWRHKGCMNSPGLLTLFLAGLVSGSSFCPAETVKDREGAVRGDQAALATDARWIYNDFQRGFGEAQRSGKPLLVVLRCVPCLACGGIDGQVIDRATDLGPLLDQFVCVRVINANALDLARFQFDYDLSFSTLFFNGDGTLYGRFGSWAHQKNALDRSTEGYRRALEGALELHRNYPANQAVLDGKQGLPVPYRTPVDLPTLAGKYQLDLDWKGKVVPSCVHCHQIGDAFRTGFRERGEVIPSQWIYPQPAPEAVGLTLESGQRARVQSVSSGSPAEAAGIQPGDDLLTVSGQSILSPADVSWALNGAPESGSVAIRMQRSGTAKTVSLGLPVHWRRRSDISRRVGTWEMRAMSMGGLLLEDLSDAERILRGVGTKNLALWVKHVGEYGRHAAAKKAGFQKDDLLVEVDGTTNRISEGELLGQLLQTHRPGETVAVTVVRQGQRVSLTLPQQ